MARSDDPGQSAIAELFERMLAIQQQQAEALATQVERTSPKENPNYQANSIFLKPSGEPWAEDLKCDIYFGSIKLNRTPITKAEVAALNQVQPVEKARLTKTDGSTQIVTVRAKENAVGVVERLTIEIDLKKEANPQHHRSLEAIALELAAQAVVAA